MKSRLKTSSVSAVLLPRLLPGRAVADGAQEAALDPAQEAQAAAAQKAVLVGEHPRHVEPERVGGDDQHDHEDGDLRDPLAHQNRSPRNSA